MYGKELSMSINTKQNVKCPGCGQLGDITVWSSITVKDSEDLKKDLLAGKVNIFRCSVCGHTGFMPTPLLYNDEDKKLMISFSPCADDVSAKKQYDEICKTSKESGEMKALEGYNLRFVTDYNEMLEKILIFDNGLNDKAVEIIKLLIMMQEPEKADDRKCRFGKLDGDNMEFMVQDFKEQQVYTSSVPKASYDSIWQNLKTSGVKDYSFGWECVNSAYATALLNGINNKFY